jgi:GNAT superfamily N-acetyltransferase
MLHAQKKEMAHLPDEAMPMLFDWAGMLTQERAGNFRMWTARVSANLAGFIVFNLHVHPFYAATPRALADAFYVAPRYRGKGILCRRMWQAALEDLGQAGIRVVIATDNEVRPMPDFFEHLGFEPTARLYMRAL